MTDKFRAKLKAEGRSLKWFHATHVRPVLDSYSYFIVQINFPEKMHETVKAIIEKYIAD